MVRMWLFLFGLGISVSTSTEPLLENVPVVKQPRHRYGCGLCGIISTRLDWWAWLAKLDCSQDYTRMYKGVNKGLYNGGDYTSEYQWDYEPENEPASVSKDDVEGAASSSYKGKQEARFVIPEDFSMSKIGTYLHPYQFPRIPGSKGRFDNSKQLLEITRLNSVLKQLNATIRENDTLYEKIKFIQQGFHIMVWVELDIYYLAANQNRRGWQQAALKKYDNMVRDLTQAGRYFRTEELVDKGKLRDHFQNLVDFLKLLNEQLGPGHIDKENDGRYYHPIGAIYTEYTGMIESVIYDLIDLISEKMFELPNLGNNIFYLIPNPRKKDCHIS